MIAPKIAAISTKFGALSGGLSGTFGGSSGGLSGGAGASVDEEVNADISGGDESVGVSAGGSGGALTSILKLSGPILSSSSASAKGGAPIPVEDSDE